MPINKMILATTIMSITSYSVPAWAYLDPGGANMFLQLVLPVLSMILAFFVFIRRWLVGNISSMFRTACSFIRRRLMQH